MERETYIAETSYSSPQLYWVTQFGAVQRVNKYIEINPLSLPVDGEVQLGRLRVLMLPTEKRVVPLFDSRSFDPIQIGEVEMDIPIPSAELQERADTAYLNALIDGAKKEISKMPENGSMSQFNKTYTGRLLELKGDTALVELGLCILHKRTTSCANTDVVFALINPNSKTWEISVPQKFVGAVIGKGGSNIKGLQNTYNRKIKITNE